VREGEAQAHHAWPIRAGAIGGGGRLQTPLVLRRCHHFKKLLFGVSSEKARGEQGVAGCSAVGGPAPNGRRFAHGRGRGPARAGPSQQRAHVGTLRAKSGPCKRGLAGWRNGRWAHRQLQVLQDLLDDAPLRNRRDDPQRALLTHGTAFHGNGKHPLEQPCPTPVRCRGAGFRLRHALLAWRRRAGPAQRAVSVASISPELSSLAIQAAKALGLIISGVDILETEKGPVVLEVNASPELMGIEAVSKVDVAASILAAVERSFGAT
jgi:hypothetical protein